MPRSEIAGFYGSSIFHFLKESSCCSAYWLHQFTFPVIVQEIFLFSTSSPAFICRLFDDSHSEGCSLLSSTIIWHIELCSSPLFSKLYLIYFKTVLSFFYQLCSLNSSLTFSTKPSPFCVAIVNFCCVNILTMVSLTLINVASLNMNLGTDTQ